MGPYDITLLWADKSVILFSLTGIKGISKIDYISCDFKKFWDMTGKSSLNLFPREQTLEKNNAISLIWGMKKHIVFFSVSWKIHSNTPLKTASVSVGC